MSTTLITANEGIPSEQDLIIISDAAVPFLLAAGWVRRDNTLHAALADTPPPFVPVIGDVELRRAESSHRTQGIHGCIQTTDRRRTMNARDELAIAIHCATDGVKLQQAQYAADAILAAGYRKPIQSFTLGTIPNDDGVIIRTGHEKTLERINGEWLAPGSMTYWSPIIDWLPATVLWEPRA